MLKVFRQAGNKHMHATCACHPVHAWPVAIARLETCDQGLNRHPRSQQHINTSLYPFERLGTRGAGLKAATVHCWNAHLGISLETPATPPFLLQDGKQPVLRRARSWRH